MSNFIIVGKLINAYIHYLGRSLLKKLTVARPEMVQHRIDYIRFSIQQKANVPTWMKLVTAWEADHSTEDPYIVPKSGQLIHV